MVVFIRMVELYKLVEALLGIRFAFRNVEDLVGGRVLRLRPVRNIVDPRN